MAREPSPSRRIADLIPVFDPVVDGMVEHRLVALGLAHRGIDLRNGVYREATESTATASVLLRSLADLLILVRWIELAPRLHARLWLVDDDLDRIAALEAVGGSLRQKGYDVPEVETLVRLSATTRCFSRLRKLAIQSGVGPARDSLLPTIRRRAQQVPGLERELYDQGIAVLSPATHSGVMSFVTTYAPQPDSHHLRLAGQPMTDRSLKSLADSLTCGILASVSRQLELAVEGKLDAIRAEVVSRPKLG